MGQAAGPGGQGAASVAFIILLNIPPLLGGGNTTCAFRAVAPQDQNLMTVRDLTGGEGGGREEGGRGCQYCHAVTHRGRIVSQGCWATGDGCSSSCILSPLGGQQLSFCCCQGSLCNWAPQQLDLTSAKHSRGRSSRGEQEKEVEQEKEGAAEGSGGLHGREQNTGGQSRGGHGGGGQGSGVESKLLHSMSVGHYTLTPTELGLLTALVLLLLVLLLLLLLMWWQQKSLTPPPGPLHNCLHNKRSCSGWSQDDSRPLLVGLGVDRSSSLVGLGVAALMDLERG